MAAVAILVSPSETGLGRTPGPIRPVRQQGKSTGDFWGNFVPEDQIRELQ